MFNACRVGVVKSAFIATDRHPVLVRNEVASAQIFGEIGTAGRMPGAIRAFWVENTVWRSAMEADLCRLCAHFMERLTAHAPGDSVSIGHWFETYAAGTAFFGADLMYALPMVFLRVLLFISPSEENVVGTVTATATILGEMMSANVAVSIHPHILAVINLVRHSSWEKHYIIRTRKSAEETFSIKGKGKSR